MSRSGDFQVNQPRLFWGGVSIAFNWPVLKPPQPVALFALFLAGENCHIWLWIHMV